MSAGSILAAGVTNNCTIDVIKTPSGAGSPAGLHTHVVDQIFYILSGTMNVEIGGAATLLGRERCSFSRPELRTAIGTLVWTRPYICRMWYRPLWMAFLLQRW